MCLISEQQSANLQSVFNGFGCFLPEIRTNKLTL